MLDSNEKIKEFYRELHVKWGNIPQGMAWKDTDTHYIRLSRIQHLLKALDIPMSSILDVGCGIAMVHDVWRLALHRTLYHGVDLVPEYVEQAQHNIFSNPNAIVTCDDFLTWGTTQRFSATLAIGTFAWQPEEEVRKIINRMWEMTEPGGAMAFTFIPAAPLAVAEVKWLRDHLGAEEFLLYNGYSKQLDEHIAVFVREDYEMPDIKGEQGDVVIVDDPVYIPAYPNVHVEEFENEVMNGEHRDDDS